MGLPYTFSTLNLTEYPKDAQGNYILPASALDENFTYVLRRIWVNTTAPTDTDKYPFWLDTSVSPNLFRLWNGSQWVTFQSAGQTVRKNSGTNIGTRKRFNFIEGAGITLTISDDSVNDEVGVTIATTWVKAKAYRSSSQTIPSGPTWTKVGINTVVYDPNSIVDTTNNRITPNKSGYYIVSGQTTVITSGAGTVVTELRKNGSAVARGSRPNSSTGAYIASNVTDIIYFNGSSDYVELYVEALAGGSLEIITQNNYLEVLGPF